MDLGCQPVVVNGSSPSIDTVEPPRADITEPSSRKRSGGRNPGKGVRDSEYKASKAVQKDATGRAHSVPTAGRGGTPWACAQLAAGGSTHADLATRAREPPRAQGPRKQKHTQGKQRHQRRKKHQSEQKGGEGSEGEVCVCVWNLVCTTGGGPQGTPRRRVREPGVRGEVGLMMHSASGAWGDPRCRWRRAPEWQPGQPPPAAPRAGPGAGRRAPPQGQAQAQGPAGARGLRAGGQHPRRRRRALCRRQHPGPWPWPWPESWTWQTHGPAAGLGRGAAFETPATTPTQSRGSEQRSRLG